MELEVRGREIVLCPLDLRDKVWGCCRDSAEGLKENSARRNGLPFFSRGS